MFSSIQQHEPQLFLQLGDLHYSGSNWLKESEFEFALREVFSKNPVQREFYQSTPLSYVFDDHDFGSNNADGRSKSRDKVNRAYRNNVRQVDLDSGVYHSFEVPVANGFKLKFIVIDVRTFKNESQNYGEEQLAWLKQELTDADHPDS